MTYYQEIMMLSNQSSTYYWHHYKLENHILMYLGPNQINLIYQYINKFKICLN